MCKTLKADLAFHFEAYVQADAVFLISHAWCLLLPLLTAP